MTATAQTAAVLPSPRAVPAAKQPPAQAVPPAPPVPAPRRRIVALTPMRQETAKRMRKLAASVQESHPDMSVHDHLRDAAKTLESGNEEASQRHLRAAMFALTPQSLMRNGLHTDDHHQAARQVMHGVHRQLLLVKDITDAAAKNQRSIARDSYGDDSTSNPPPASPVRADPNAGYGPGALAQKPAARQPPGDRALNAPNRTGTGKPDPNVADPAGPQPRGSKQFANGLDLSAETGRLASTPAPRGKPGGPGLYRVKNLQHTPYFQNVVKALIEKRGMPPGKAYAVAYGALRKWSRGGGKVHPEVRAAAAGSLAGEKAEGAMARAVHGHAVTWDDVLLVVELAVREGPRVDLAAPPPPYNPAQPRVPKGQAGGGQFGSSGQAQQQAGAKSVASKTASASAKATAAKNSQQKKALQQKAAGFRAQADALIAKRNALRQELASASGATNSGQSGSTTSAGSSTTSSGASTTASTAPAASTAASSTPASSPSATSSSGSTSLTSAQKAQIGAQIAQMNTQILGLQAQYRQAMAQAAKA